MRNVCECEVPHITLDPACDVECCVRCCGTIVYDEESDPELNSLCMECVDPDCEGCE